MLGSELDVQRSVIDGVFGMLGWFGGLHGVCLCLGLILVDVMRCMPLCLVMDFVA